MTKLAEKILTQGELLDELWQWSGMTQDEFASTYKKKRHQFMKDRDLERLTLADKFALSGYHNVPMEYWEGKYKLQPKYRKPDDEHKAQQTGETDLDYSTRTQQLLDQIQKLSDQLSKANETIMEQAATINSLVRRLG